MAQSFGEALKEIRLSRDMAQDEFAALLGTTKQVISRYEKGLRVPKITVVKEYSEKLRVPLSFLLCDPDSPSPIPTVSNILPMPKTYKVPLIGTIACGQPILAVEGMEETIDVPEWVNADFALKCKGDSMINARIFDGDIVFIKQRPKVENGQIAAVRIEDEATLKKVYYVPDSGRIVLRACNPLFSDMVYEGETLNQIEILGLAVGFYSKVRHGQ